MISHLKVVELKTLSPPRASSGLEFQVLRTEHLGGVEVISYYHFPMGEGNGNPLQYSCLENPMDGGAWATVYGVAKSWTRLSDFTFTFISPCGPSEGDEGDHPPIAMTS